MINREKEENKALSILVGYALNIFVAAILIGIITIATANAVDNVERDSMNSQAYTISSDVSYQIEKIDRLGSEENMNVTYRLEAPEASYPYLIEIKEEFIIINHETDTVLMPLNTNNTIEEFQVQSGATIIIEVKPNENKIQKE